MFPISLQVYVYLMCHLYLLYSARSLGLGNQFHKDTGLISAAVHIMRRALLLSSAELPARGHEQINRDVTQLPHSPAPQRTQRWEGDVVRGGGEGWGHKEQNTQQGRVTTPVSCLLLCPTFRISSSVLRTRFISREAHPS